MRSAEGAGFTENGLMMVSDYMFGPDAGAFLVSQRRGESRFGTGFTIPPHLIDRRISATKKHD